MSSEPKKPEKKTVKFNWSNLVALLFFCGVMYYISTTGSHKPKAESVPISFFFEQLGAKKVATVEIKESTVRWQNVSGNSFVSVDDRLHIEKLITAINEYNRLEKPIRLEVKKPSSSFFSYWLILMAIFFLLPMVMNRRVPFLSGIRAKQVNGTVTTTFKDVAGIDESKEEVTDIVDFLKNPEKYRMMGAKIPRGVLLVGPPGCGKTLLARAVAGEAGVPFFTICGSDFIEMFVGVGASRVRELFSKAKEQTPSIIFIDEIDAVGGKRGGIRFAGHDEGAQTLNAMLSEMDGFSDQDQVIIIGATNRPDTLDPAMLRPGRFDRVVNVSLPDQSGRLMILQVHVKKIVLDPEVSLENLAATTAGMSGAELENILNEAAIICVKRGGQHVQDCDLEEARDKQMVGKQMKSRHLTDEDKRIIAFHESGHATAQTILPGCDPVHKITIIPQGQSLGLTMFLPKRDIALYTKTQLESQIKVLLAGRAAEHLFGKDITTGAEQDLRVATEIAREMIGRFGMNDQVGLMSAAVYDQQGVPLISSSTASLVDREVRKMLDQAFEEVSQLLKTNEQLVHALANALAEKETLRATQIEEIISEQQVA